MILTRLQTTGRGFEARRVARRGPRSILIWAMGLASLVASGPALAGCCRVVRVDPETASAQVQICEPDFEGHCGSVLFTGILAVGEAADVCSASDSVVYQEYDATLGGFAPEIGAMCEGGDVEI